MAPTFVIGSWMALAGHVLASAGHHHHQHLHHQRDAIIHTLPIPSEVANVVVDDFARGPATTAAPSLGDSCGQVNDAIVSCADIIPHFDKADKAQIGQCLCCSGKMYTPNIFDGKAAQCASYIKSLAPSSTDAINQWAALESFCGSKGPVSNIAGVCTKSYSYKPKAAQTVANVGAPVTAAAATSVAAACLSIEAIGNSCVQATPGFGKLAAKSQAECYCYNKSSSTTAWIPNRLGGYASKCADWAEHASQTSLASVASDLVGLCSGYGDFLAEAPTTTTTNNNIAIAAIPTLIGSEQPSGTTAAAMITSDTATPAATGASAGVSTPTAVVTSSAMAKQFPAVLMLCVGAVMWLV